MKICSRLYPESGAGLQIVLLVLVRPRRLDRGRGALDNQTEDPSALAALNRAAPAPGDAPRGGYSDLAREWRWQR